MKASQILRESQGKRKQHFGNYIRLNGNGEVDSYCALGAIGCELGAIDKYGAYSDLSKIIEKVLGITTSEKIHESASPYSMVNCNVDKGREDMCSHGNNMYHFIVHLNDVHHLSFEEIAEILEQYGL